ncbi:hypothetical protein [Streptomyces atacamensis]|uniref:hypothetical protein n=1 Tax=Streptomyces atacamensis TaxID=531966 RepID=UPI00399C915C
MGNASRAAITSDRRITGLPTEVIAELVAEAGPLRHERHQARLTSRPRKRAVGAGAKHRLVFVDRLLATLMHLRHATTHDVPAVEVLADAGYQGLGAQTGGRVITPPRRKFTKNAPDWYETMYQRQRTAHSSRRIRVEHGIAHLKNRRALARHLGRREHIGDTAQAVAGLLSHQQTADLIRARQR